MKILPTIPNPHRHESDLTALVRVSLFVGFVLGALVASVAWLLALSR